jgi:hypothetical protein
LHLFSELLSHLVRYLDCFATYEACGPALQKVAAATRIVAQGVAGALEDDTAILIYPNSAGIDVPKHNIVVSKLVCSVYSKLQEAPYALIHLPFESPILSRA